MDDKKAKPLHLILLHICFLVSQMTNVTSKVQHEPGTPFPSFGDPIQNITVIKGRDITFTCIVKHLGQYKVGWVKADTKAIQAIHHQVVTHNPRVSVTYRDKSTWSLHIKDVQEDDRGVYMCQVNTDPMIAEMAHLEVVVPPEIVDEESSGETEVEEGSSVNLVCKAKGHPIPRVSWQREGGKEIVLRDHGSKKVSTVEGEILNLSKVKRQDMGPYLCIANNKIPPSVSKRIMLRVNFKPVLEVPLHMFGSPFGNNVTINCRVEASPKAVNTWRKVPGEQMIISSPKYDVVNKHEGYYVTQMSLTIKNFTRSDATNYVCSSSNSLGYSESTIQVYEIPTPINKNEESEESDKNTESKTPKERDSKKTASGFPQNNRLDNLIDSFPKDGKKGVASGLNGSKQRHRENSQIEMLEGSSEDKAANPVDTSTKDIFTFLTGGSSPFKEFIFSKMTFIVVILSLAMNLNIPF